MKKVLIIPFLVLLFAVESTLAQTVYLPNGTSGIGTSSNSFVGVGTNNPSSNLHVWDNVAGQIHILVQNNFNGGARTFLSSESGKSSIQSDKDFAIRTNGGGWSDKVMVKNNGNVGIGTLLPAEKLEVNGKLLIKSDNSELSLFSNGIEEPILKFRQNGHGQDGNIRLNTTGMIFSVENFDDAFTIRRNGSVGIGTLTPDTGAKLTVAGRIFSREIKVTVDAGADHVFQDDYKLQELDKLEAFIQENKHLPESPSEKEMQENGLEVGEFQIKLLQKIEELTLYVIDLKKENDYLRQKVSNIDDLTKRLMKCE